DERIDDASTSDPTVTLSVAAAMNPIVVIASKAPETVPSGASAYGRSESHTESKPVRSAVRAAATTGSGPSAPAMSISYCGRFNPTRIDTSFERGRVGFRAVPGLRDYRFTSYWRVRGAVGEAYAGLHDLASYPEGWPG